jgi:hypothetical protein
MSVPFKQEDHARYLATPRGHLLYNLVHTPAAILSPLICLCQNTANLCVGSDYKSKFAQLFCRVLRLAVDIERFAIFAQQESDATHKKCDEQEQLRTFFRHNAVDLLLVCMLQAKETNDIPFCLEFRSLLVLVHGTLLEIEDTSTTESKSALVNNQQASALSDFMCSSAYIVSWHSKADPKGISIHSVFYALELRRRGTMAVIREHRLEQHLLEAMLEAISMAATTQADLVNADTEAGDKAENEAPVQSISCWHPVPKVTQECARVISSPHPYPSCTDVYEEICFPGADYLCVTFDPRTCTEKGSDYITFFKDNTHTATWGNVRYSGGITGNDTWPGVNGQKPLVIPADRCVFHFHSDVGGEEWGYKLQVSGPVSKAAATRLRAKLVGDLKDLTVQTCMVALDKTLNNESEAESYLRSNAAKLEKEANKAGFAATVTEGAYQDKTRGLQVNLQTAEVYVNSSMLMSLPPEIRKHIETTTVFGDIGGPSVYCTALAKNENRRLFSLQHRGMSYRIAAWNPIRAQSTSQLNATKDCLQLEALQLEAAGRGVNDSELDIDNESDVNEALVALPKPVEGAAVMLQSFLELLEGEFHMQLTSEQQQRVVELMWSMGFDSFDALLVLQEADVDSLFKELYHPKSPHKLLPPALAPKLPTLKLAHLRLIVLHTRRLAVQHREDGRQEGTTEMLTARGAPAVTYGPIQRNDKQQQQQQQQRRRQQQHICRWILRIEYPGNKWVVAAAATAIKPITSAWAKEMLLYTNNTARGSKDNDRMAILESLEKADCKLERAAEALFGARKSKQDVRSGNRWNLRGLDKIGAINYPHQTDEGLCFCSNLFIPIEWEPSIKGGGLSSSVAWSIKMMNEYWVLLAKDLHLNAAERPSLWVWDGNGTSPFAQVLMYLPALGDQSLKDGHPGMLYEAVKLLHRDVLQIYSLWDQARTYQRRLAWTSDLSLCYADLTRQTDIQQASRRRPGLEFSAGNFLSGIQADGGKSIIGAQNAIELDTWHAELVGSLDVRRNRHQQRVKYERAHHTELLADAAVLQAMEAELPYEQLVPHQFLDGLLPQALLEGFVFWRTGKLTLRGYPFVNPTVLAQLDSMTPEKREAWLKTQGTPYWKGRSLLVHLQSVSVGGGKTPPVVATVFALPSPDFEHTFVDGELEILTEAQSKRCLVLLNAVEASEGTALFRIVERLRYMELLAHTLVWTYAQPRAAEECQIAEIEMPRLGRGGLVFETDGSKLKCKQYAGWFISERFQEQACRKLRGGARYGLWLENSAGALSLLTPGFKLDRYSITTCNLTSVHTIGIESDKAALSKQVVFFELHSGVYHVPLYLYQAHVSLVYMEPPDFESKLYLAYLRLTSMDYEGTFRMLTSCFSDGAFSQKVKQYVDWILPMSQNIRGCSSALMIALMFIEGKQEVFKYQPIYKAYLANISAISASCRLTPTDEKVLAIHSKQKQRLKFIEACLEWEANDQEVNGTSEVPLDLTGAQKYELKRKNGGIYPFEFRSKVEDTLSNMQKLYNFETEKDEARVPEKPSNVSVKPFEETEESGSIEGDNAVTLEWDKCPRNNNGGANLLGYKVQYKVQTKAGGNAGGKGLIWKAGELFIMPSDPVPTARQKQKKQNKNKKALQNLQIKCSWSLESKAVIHGLQPDSVYEFQVASINRIGCSEFSAVSAETVYHQKLTQRSAGKRKGKKEAGVEETDYSTALVPYKKYRKSATDLPFEALYPYDRPNKVLEKMDAMKEVDGLFRCGWPHKPPWCLLLELLKGKVRINLNELRGDQPSEVPRKPHDPDRKYDPVFPGTITCGYCSFECMFPSMLVCPECGCVNYFFDPDLKPELNSKLDEDAKLVGNDAAIPQSTVNLAELSLLWHIINQRPFFELCPTKFSVELSCLCVFMHTFSGAKTKEALPICGELKELGPVPTAMGHLHSRSMQRYPSNYFGYPTNSPGYLRDWLLQMTGTAVKVLHRLKSEDSWDATKVYERIPREKDPKCPIVDIANTKWLPSRPVMPDCKRESRTLLPLQLGSDMSDLCLASNDIAAFAEHPLSVVMEKFTQKRPPGANKGAESLQLDLDQLQQLCGGSVAKSVVDRLKQDVEKFEKKEAETYELTFFPFEKFAELEAALIAANGDRSSGKKLEALRMLTKGIGDLGKMKDDLFELKTRENQQLENALVQLESMANSGSDSNASMLSQVAGVRAKLWFETIASAFVTDQGLEQLAVYNPSLLENKPAIFEAVAGVLFRTVRISQAGMCIGLTFELIDHFKVLLSNELLLSFLVEEQGTAVHKPTERMIAASLHLKGHDTVEAAALIRGWLRQVEDWSESYCLAIREVTSSQLLQTKLANIEDSAIVTYVYELTNFDSEAAMAVFKSPQQLRALLELASRGCCVDGKLPNSLPRANVDVAEEMNASLNQISRKQKAVLYVAQQTAAAIVDDGLRAKRAYVTTIDNHGEQKVASYDPRFLLFEFIIGFMLRSSQYDVIRNFKTSDSTYSRVQQMIMGAGKTTGKQLCM